MTESAGAGSEGAARLDELAAVTREYAAYSRSAYGAAFVVTGGAVLVVLCVDLWARSSWARPAYVMLPLLWLLSLAAARAYYQRRGSVTERDQHIRGRGWMLSLVYLTSAVGLLNLTGQTLREALTSEGLSAASLTTVVLGHLALVAVPLLSAELVRGNRDAVITTSIVLVASPLFGLASPLPAIHGSPLERLNQAQAVVRGLMLGLAGVTAMALMIGGVLEHRRARVLERRLAALRSPPA